MGQTQKDARLSQLQAQRQRQQGRDAAELARRASAERDRRGPGVRDGGRSRHHRAPASRCPAHHVRRRAHGGRRAQDRPPGDRVQYRGRSAARSAGARARGPPPPVHARARPRRRDHEPGRLAVEHAGLRRCRRRSAICSGAGIRVSVFIDPDLEAVRWAASLDADRIELYTEPYARAFEKGGRERQESFERYAAAAEARAQPRPRHQRRPRPRSRQPEAVQDAPAPRRGVDRPRAHQPRALRGARSGGQGLSGGPG